MINILLSTYNGERYLAQQLDSIIAQTYMDWKLYVRDDGSTDDTLRILEQYSKQDKRIAIMPDSGNVGARRSFERLLTQYDKADYFAFSDQDDVWLPDKLELSMKVMKEAEMAHPDTPVIVHTDLQVVDEQLQLIAPSFWRYGGIVPGILDVNIHYLAICNSVTGCTMLMNKAARQVALPFNPDVFMHDAWIAIAVLAAGGKVLPIPQPSILYRQHTDNVCGAQHYRFRLTNLREKKRLALRSYQTGHPLAFRNKVHFLWWKMRYFFVLHSYRLRYA